jgi:hypothetical protein
MLKNNLGDMASEVVGSERGFLLTIFLVAAVELCFLALWLL